MLTLINPNPNPYTTLNQKRMLTHINPNPNPYTTLNQKRMLTLINPNPNPYTTLNQKRMLTLINPNPNPYTTLNQKRMLTLINPNPNPYTTLNQKPNDNPRSYSLSPEISSQEQLSPKQMLDPLWWLLKIIHFFLSADWHGVPKGACSRRTPALHIPRESCWMGPDTPTKITGEHNILKKKK